MPYYHGFIWTFSLITSLLPLTTESYGQSGGWCWVKDGEEVDIMWRFVIFYIPLWVAIMYIGYMYYCTYKEIGLETPIMRQVGLYPAILVFSWFFATINRIQQVADDANYGLTMTHAFLWVYTGFVIFWRMCIHL
eukprot:UN32184